MKKLHQKIARVLTLSLITVSLTACFDDDDDLDIEPNVPPLAADIDLITQTETVIQGAIPASDANGDTLTYAITSDPMLGVVTVTANGGFTYTPNAELTGTDSFMYSVTDGQTDPVSATVNITIEALQVSFSDFSRNAFNQDANDTPVSVNGREFTQDVVNQNDYQDLIDAN